MHGRFVYLITKGHDVTRKTRITSTPLITLSLICDAWKRQLHSLQVSHLFAANRLSNDDLADQSFRVCRIPHAAEHTQSTTPSAQVAWRRQYQVTSLLHNTSMTTFLSRFSTIYCTMRTSCIPVIGNHTKKMFWLFRKFHRLWCFLLSVLILNFYQNVINIDRLCEKQREFLKV